MTPTRMVVLLAAVLALPPADARAAPPGPAPPVRPVAALLRSATPAPDTARTAPVTGFRSPLPGPLVVTRAFRRPPGRYAAGHRGVDLAAAVGAPVLAAAAGTVVFAGPLAGRGVVSVRHAGGLRTTYEPVSATVSAGQLVRAGQLIATVSAGHPGCPVAACLHWGAVLPDGTYLDPMTLLLGIRVRLQPWAGS